MRKNLLRDCLRIAEKKNLNHPEWGHYHHFSFVIQNNKIVEWGTNKNGPPLIQYGYVPFGKLHSETEAYRKAKGVLSNGSFEVVNIRLNRSGEIRLSKPCKCCYNFLRAVGCKSVWFTTEAGWAKISL